MELFFCYFCRLQQWMKRKNLDAPSEADSRPTASISCPHGQLLPEQATGAKRVIIPEDLWLFIHEDAMRIKPDDLSGCTSFPIDSEPCAECSNALSEVACMEDSIRLYLVCCLYFALATVSLKLLSLCCRALKLKQRQTHEKLALGKSIPLIANSKYYLVPSSWLARWRNYINASGKNISLSVEPENLDVVINLLKCEKVIHHYLYFLTSEMVVRWHLVPLGVNLSGIPCSFQSSLAARLETAMQS